MSIWTVSRPHRVRRGGSWDFGLSDARVVERYAVAPGVRYISPGLRLVRRCT